MSLSIERVIPLTVADPRIVQMDRTYPVLKGGREVLYKEYTTTNISQSSVTFSAPPPSMNVYVDRRIHLLLPVRVEIVATNPGAGASPLVAEPHRFAIRSYPAQKAMDSIQMTLNNQSMSVNIGDILSAIELFNIDCELKRVDFSKCPTVGCWQAQEFSSLYQGNRSPMALYIDAPTCAPSASFPFTVAAQDLSTNVCTTKVDFVTCEPLFLSPLYWGAFDHDESAFWGLKTMDFTFNFKSNAANRMVAIDPVATDAWTSTAITTMNASFSNFSSPAFSYAETQPKLLLQYLTPQLADRQVSHDKVLNYPYFNIEQYVTDLPAIAAGATTNASTSSVQLNSIPSRLYVFARKRNQDLLALPGAGEPTIGPFATDTFLKISSVSLQWGNRSGVLSSANMRQIYDLAVKAGCQLSWAEWSGEKLVNSTAGADGSGFGYAANQYAGCGSVMCIEPLDVGLDSLDAPGKNDHLMIQLTLGLQNVSAASITPAIYVVAVSQGLFSIYNGQASSMIGVLSSQDILDSHAQAANKMISYSDVQDMYGGRMRGNFFGKLKAGLLGALKAGVPLAKACAPCALEIGKAVAGAGPMSKKELKDRLKRI